MRHQARYLVHRAVAAGTLKKPSACEDCGAVPAPRDLHGHHDDYDQPLNVRWLCRLCHKRAHRLIALVPPWTPTIEPLLTLPEVAERLRASMNSLYAWVGNGTLPAIRVGKKWRVQRSDLDAWMDSQRNVEAPV